MNKEESVFKILLIDDNQDSIVIARRALKKVELNNQLWIAENGEEGLGLLKKCKEEKKDKEDSSRPDLILLDVNLPKIDGMEVLKEVKADPLLKKIPVVVLTGSNRDADKLKSYELGCNSYIQKSSRFEEFVRVINKIVEYWGTINNPPPLAEE